MQIIIKNTISYCIIKNNKLFCIVLSFRKGWGLFLLKKQFFLVKSLEFYPLFFYEKSFFNWLTIIFFGFQKGYFKYIKLKGIGYKFIVFRNNIILKFGFSHRIIYKSYLDVYCKYLNKYLLLFVSRSFWRVDCIYNWFRFLRKFNVYKKKGIFLKGAYINIKINNKKAKF